MPESTSCYRRSVCGKASAVSGLDDLRRISRVAALGLLLCGMALSGHADDGWVTVFGDGARQVQIDRASVLPSDGGTRVAWARVLLSSSEADGTDHVAAHALNRYDCVNRSVTTLRRRFVDARNMIVREEVPTLLRAQAVVSGTVDERLWREICQPATLRDLARIAAEAESIVAATTPEAAQAAGGRQVQAAAPVTEAVLMSVAEAAAVAAAAATLANEPVAPEQRAAAPPSVTASVTPSVTAIQAAEAATRATRAAQRQPAGPTIHWSYHGDKGPEHWAQLSPEWKLCATGQRQSPIDLRGGIRLDLDAPRFEYGPTRFRVSDSGRALEVHVGAGLAAVIRGHVFELNHLSFHVPAEVRVDGRASPLAVHLHHRSADNSHAVLVVLFESGAEPHPELQTVLNNLPLDRGGWYMPQVTFDPLAFLPQQPGHFEFHGSLSTPPCTEGVVWIVMKSPLTASLEQIQILRRLHSDNVRPIQAANDRLILETR